ncbi:hypothetical protein PS2_028178 [Malus domestica]
MYGLMFTVSTDFKKFEGHVPGHFSMIKQGIYSRGLHEDSGKFKFPLSVNWGDLTQERARSQRPSRTWFANNEENLQVPQTPDINEENAQFLHKTPIWESFPSSDFSLYGTADSEEKAFLRSWPASE